MRLAAIFFLLFLGLSAGAQQSYDAGSIPKEMLSYASAVIRNQEETIEVKDINSTIIHFKTAITILNKNGDDMARVLVWHNGSDHIRSIKGLMYDEYGKPTGKFSEGDFEDDNTSDGFSLFQDVKVKHYQPVETNYPYTIEYEYEIRSDQTLFFPEWRVNPESGTSVQNSSLTFICKPDFNIRYKEINMPVAVNIGTNKNGLKTYTWEVKNIKAQKYEPYTPIAEHYWQMVKIAPVNFEYEGIKGEFTNWNELGKWTYDKLLAGRQAVSPETVQTVQDLTIGITDPKLKAKKIYEYMQGKTHYVSIQIGIGGFQPFAALDVDRLNYGDCKALVNYTQALLKAVNVNSYYCVVEAGDKKVSMLNDFASMDQGDHIILCLPFKNDTTWCDCTSQTIPFGYLGDFTDDRTVLACTPEGGKLLHTPKYTVKDNLEKRKVGFIINETGELSGNITTNFSGIEYEQRDWLITQSQKDQIKHIPNIYSSINNIHIEQLTFKQDKSLQPVTTENLKITAPEFAAVGDNKITFLVNPVNRVYQYEVPKQVRNRIYDVYINDGTTDEDDITYNIPAGYHLWNTPLDIVINKPFGKFKATVKIEGNTLTYKRKLQLNDGTYPKDSYNDVVDFYQSVADADDYSVMLIKNN